MKKFTGSCLALFIVLIATSAFSVTVRDKMTYEGPVTFKGTVTTSGATSQTGAQTFANTVTLDDGSGASPDFILKDATDETVTFSKVDAGYVTVTTVAGDGVNVLTGNLKVGNGTPGVTLGGEDAYVEGTFEVDGATTLDGLLTGTAGATVTGGVVNLNASSNNAVNIGTGTTTSTVTIGGAGAQTIAVGDGAAAKTVSLGSSNTTSTTTILSGSGGLNLNEDNNQPVDIGTGTSTGTVTIGGAAAQTIAIGAGAAAKTVTLGSTNTTSTTNINAGSGGVVVTGTMAATSPKITTSILDADGDPMLGFTASAGTAVNYWRFDNAATGVIPAINMIGDTNVSLSLNLKGSGALRVQNQTANDDTIAIAPATGGAGSYTGTLTSAELLAARTWTIPDATGTVSLNCTASHDYAAGVVDWTLTAAEAACSYITVTNASGAVNAILPAATPGKTYTVNNAAGFALTYKVTGQTGGTVANAKWAFYTTGAADVLEVYELP